VTGTPAAAGVLGLEHDAAVRRIDDVDVGDRMPRNSFEAEKHQMPGTPGAPEVAAGAAIVTFSILVGTVPKPTNG
jgi:hypothetical protein